MNLKGIKLPVSIIADLYSNNLIEGSEIAKNNPTITVAEKEISLEKQLVFLGNNKKNILILVDNADVKFIEDVDLSFLTNILTACKLSLNDVAIVNIAHSSDFSYKEATADLASSTILLLGPTPSDLNLPLDFPTYQVQPFGSTTLLSAPPIAEIKNDQLQKSKLWVCLRKIFNL